MPRLEVLGRQLVSEIKGGKGLEIYEVLRTGERPRDQRATQLDLGSFLEGLTEADLSPAAHGAAKEAIAALCDCRLDYHSDSLQVPEETSRPDELPTSYEGLRGLTFNARPNGQRGTWKEFLGMFKVATVSFHQKRSTVSSPAIDKAVEHFQEGEPVMLTVSSQHGLARVEETLKSMEIPC